MARTFKVAGVGEVVWDILGENQTFGGAPANFSCHCGMLGAHAYVVSCVGDDALGARSRVFLCDHGVDVSGLAVSEAYGTGTVQVQLGRNGQPAYEIREGTAWDNLPFTDELAALAPQLDAVCFGSLSQRSAVSRASISRFLDAVAPTCLRMFDVNLRQDYYTDEVLLNSLRQANALKVNDEELPIVAALLGIAGSEEEQLRGVASACTLDLAVLTCGARGAWIMTPDETSFVSASALSTIASTVGAGDSFTAAVVMGYLHGNALEEINQHANRLAAYVCTQLGAVPHLPQTLRTGVTP